MSKTEVKIGIFGSPTERGIVRMQEVLDEKLPSNYSYTFVTRYRIDKVKLYTTLSRDYMVAHDVRIETKLVSPLSSREATKQRDNAILEECQYYIAFVHRALRTPTMDAFEQLLNAMGAFIIYVTGEIDETVEVRR